MNLRAGKMGNGIWGWIHIQDFYYCGWDYGVRGVESGFGENGSEIILVKS